MRVPSLSAALFAFALSACGSAPPPVEKTVEAPPEAPAPDVANPCDATSIDPTENPCAGPAAAAAKAEAEAATASGEGDEKAEGEKAEGEKAAEKPADGAEKADAKPADAAEKAADGDD